MRRFTAVVASALLMTTLATAHAGMEHIVGTVSAVSDHSITVKTTAGESKEAGVDSSTKIVRGDATVALSDVMVGDRIVVHAQKHDGKLQAAEVELGKAKPAAKGK